jgi:hypothetical protein
MTALHTSLPIATFHRERTARCSAFADERRIIAATMGAERTYERVRPGSRRSIRFTDTRFVARRSRAECEACRSQMEFGRLERGAHRFPVNPPVGSSVQSEYIDSPLHPIRGLAQDPLCAKMVEGKGAMAKLTNTIIEAAIYGFEAQKKDIDTQIAELRAMLTGVPGSATADAPPKGTRRKFSAAARRRMREAQQLRWAKIKGQSTPSAKAPAKAANPKRGLTAAGRKALSIAMKKRWAAKKAAA